MQKLTISCGYSTEYGANYDLAVVVTNESYTIKAQLSANKFNQVRPLVLAFFKQNGKNLAQADINHTTTINVPDDMAQRLVLIFRALAPMYDSEKMQRCVQHITTMPINTVIYWLNLANKNRHAAYKALRTVLTAMPA